MIIQLTPKQLKEDLEELLRWDALEMQVRTAPGTDRKEVLIPYLMNDAVECFFRLTDAVVHGTLTPPDSGEETEDAGIELEEGTDRTGILIRQKDRTVSIWYRKAAKEQHCYQYHRIGHNWRKSREQEEIRRLVNLLCVLADKHSYLTPEATNPLEQKLWPLIHFSPLCAWSPISSSILDWYPETEEGICAMLDLAEETGDTDYRKQLLIYRKEFLHSGKKPSRKMQKTGKLLRDMLAEDAHRPLLRELENRIEQASSFWKPRRYTTEQETEMEQLRKQREESCKNSGYEGTYPLLTRNGTELLFVEEHPFTVLEAEEYHFSIYEIQRPNCTS